MATFTATADSSSTIGFATYNSSSWQTGSSNGACQGIYTTSSASSSLSRVGVMVFSGLGAAVNGRNISSITLKITTSSSGNDSSSKVLTLHKAKTQSLSTSIKGSEQVGDTLGTLTGHFYGTTLTFTLSSSSNASLFSAMKAYFESGNSVLVCYNGESSKLNNNDYSTHYLRITSITATVEYSAATAYYYDGSNWKTAEAVYYYDGSVWKEVDSIKYSQTAGSFVDTTS